MLSFDDDLRVASLEATPALRQAISESPKTFLQLGMAANLAPCQITRIRQGAAFTKKLRDRVIALGAVLGVAPDQCVQRRVRTTGKSRAR